MTTLQKLCMLTALSLPLIACDDDAKAKPFENPVMIEPKGDQGSENAGADEPVGTGEPDMAKPEEDKPVEQPPSEAKPDEMMATVPTPPTKAPTKGPVPVKMDPPPPAAAPWYTCQGSDQRFVRTAMLAVLGRRPYSQAEVNVYTDLISQIDAMDEKTKNVESHAPGSELRLSRRAALSAMFQDPGYAPYWGELNRDFLRVQRVDEQVNKDCFEKAVSTDPAATALYVRDHVASAAAGESPEFTMADVLAGSIAIDDITPIYTANLFAMLSKAYLGANAAPPSLELTRRRDFGAWFDAVYLHRDTVCLQCHNSEFSVTQTNDPNTNRHFPVKGLLEKSLFGSSTGPSTFGGFEGGDRMHAPLKYKGFVNDCPEKTITQKEADDKKIKYPECATKDELLHRCLNEVVCETTYAKLPRVRPWGWAKECGIYTPPEQIAVDIAGVEARFGNLTGLRSSPWTLSESLRVGFQKLRAEGLGVSDNGEISDPDKAFAYLVAMNHAEKVWIQVVGTPLTIPNRFPRNAAARDQLQSLTDVFVRSGFSNKKLIEAVLASPYINAATPQTGCGDAYAMPAVFDPWVIAESDPVKRKNSAVDAVVSMNARTATTALFAALEWKPLAISSFPDVLALDEKDPTLEPISEEKSFQSEVGFYLKNSEPGFRGFDFQARLGWENRFARCEKPDSAKDFIDKLVDAAPETSTMTDLVSALKDRLVGRTTIDDMSEKPALEALLGAPLTAAASAVEDPTGALRKLCGVLASSPQFMMLGLAPNDSAAVPTLTPAAVSYATTCVKLAKAVTQEVSVSCPAAGPLTVFLR